MRKLNAFLLLSLVAASHSVVAAPGEAPFSKRYPSASIQTLPRAQEVIEAYHKETQAWNEWEKKEDKVCYTKFLINDCRRQVRKTALEARNDARKVWLVARDFERQYKAQEVQKAREARIAKDRSKKGRAELSPKREARDLSVSPKEASRDTKTQMEQGRLSRQQETEERSRLEEINQRAYEAKVQERENKRSERVGHLTAEEEEANRQKFAQKQLEHAKKQEEARDKEPKNISSLTTQERENSRAQRRRENEQRQLERLRKRAEKAAAYQAEVQKREEHQNALSNALKP